MIICTEKDCHAPAVARIQNKTTTKDHPFGKAVCETHVGNKKHITKKIETDDEN